MGLIFYTVPDKECYDQDKPGKQAVYNTESGGNSKTVVSACMI